MKLTSMLLRPRFVCSLVAIVGFLLAGSFEASAQGPQAQSKADPLKNLQFRLVGPFRGGRVGAVEGVADNPKVYYYGGTGGGVWKTTDGGVNWFNLSDGYFKTATI